MNLLSDQVDASEIEILLRELEVVLSNELVGNVVELGCYVGTTSISLARALATTDKKLYLYDSFEGLPEKSREDTSPAGEQFKKGELLATKAELIRNFKKANVPMPIVKKAWFKDLAEKDLPDEICFAFLDGDYYESILTSLKLVWPRLSSGAVIIVDDYANEALPGAAKAVDQWLKAHKASIRVEHSLAIIKPS